MTQQVYSYFVRFELSNIDGVIGVRNTEVAMRKPISGIQDVERIEQMIAKDLSTRKQSCRVSIINWQPFGVENE